MQLGILNTIRFSVFDYGNIKSVGYSVAEGGLSLVALAKWEAILPFDGLRALLLPTSMN